jgi:5,10-methylenetetrahydromethanopterin reductase
MSAGDKKKMPNNKTPNLGIMFRREHAPEKLPDFARQAEAAGFDELWLVEDCFFGSGFASAAVALSTTESIRVGLGIMPAVVRNPVFTAMEIATLARLYPGRFLPGIGHGVAGWMRQIGAFPKSQMAALEDVTVSTRRLLTGERFSFEGRHVQLDDVELVHPPAQPPLISLGVRGPKSLALSGRIADGTILAEYAAPAYVSWAREQIAAGQQSAGRTADHRLTVFAFSCPAATVEDAYRALRPQLANDLTGGDFDLQLAPLGILPQLKAVRENGGRAQLESAISDDWLDQLTIAGPPQAWQHAIQQLAAAGADTVVLTPLPDKGVDELDRLAKWISK